MYLGYQNGKIKFYTAIPLNNTLYNLDRIEQTDDTYILVGDEYVLTTDPKAVEQAKQAKISENDTARDAALDAGVMYKEVLFDSDTDQKVNLLAIVSTMSDEDTITWFGKDNQPLECTKEDLTNIGNLITLLDNFCWTKNAEVKSLINLAETVEEVNAIEIDYTMPEPEPEDEETPEEEGE